MSNEQMKEFERCKEERFFVLNKSSSFTDFLAASCQSSFEFLSNKKIFFDFTSYILSTQVK
jgi:hypothetical protein